MKKQQYDWKKIPEFYAGRPITEFAFKDLGGKQGTTDAPESGKIYLSPEMKKSLDDLTKYGPRSRQGMVLGARGLSTLIHEAVHNRNFANTTGFRDAGNEEQATDLGWRLLPDAMQRFFGIDINYAWGQKYMDMVMKQLRK